MTRSKRVRRDVLVRFLVTEQESKAMQDAAAASDVTLAEWIRRHCFTVTTAIAVAPPARRA